MLRFRSAAALLGAILWWAPLGLAQDTPKDDDIDSLLEKVEKATRDDAQPNEPKAPDAKPDDARPDEPKAADAAKPNEPKPGADLPPKDQALDDLLKGLGETKETPAPDEKPKKPGPEGDPPPGPPPSPDAVKPEDKTTDEHLDELQGHKRRKKDQKQDGDGQGPLVETVKKMREVEKRLGEPDTGEETQDKQKQIVKNLDQILEQVRIIRVKGKGDPKSRMVGQQGKKPGDGPQPGSTPGTGQQGVVPPKIASKEVKKGPLVNGKDEWGHLPADLRAEMNNVTNEKPLSAKEELIRLYYLSVAKKSQSRED